MSNYLYFESLQRDLVDRYNLNADAYEDIRGLSIWRDHISLLSAFLSTGFEGGQQEYAYYIQRFAEEMFPPAESGQTLFYEQPTRSAGEIILMHLLYEIRRAQLKPLTSRCPRLFISHRQSDWIHGLSMVKIAQRSGFEYWLDILDPLLTHITKSTTIHPTLLPLLTACIIEMSLINCTHVIACMTPNSRGSLWQPYEYGRIADTQGYFKKAAAWPHPNLSVKDFPEYMYLGEIVSNRSMIENWLKAEYAAMVRKNCGINKGTALDDYEVPELPGKVDPGFDAHDFPYYVSIFNEELKEASHAIINPDEERKFLGELLAILSDIKKNKPEVKAVIKVDRKQEIKISLALDHDIIAPPTAKFKKK